MSAAALSLCVGACSAGPEAGGIEDPPPNVNAMEDYRCVPAGEAPSVLVDSRDLRPDDLTIDRATLYFGSFTGADPSKTGAIYRLPAFDGKSPPGTPEILNDKDYLSGPIASTAESLIFMKGVAVPTGPTSVAYSYPYVLIQDKASKALTQVPTPPPDDQVGGLVMSKSGIYFASRSNTRVSIARFDPATRMTQVLATLANASQIFTDDRSVYYLRIQGPETLLEAVPTTGGAATVIHRFPYDPPRSSVTVLGLAGDLFYFHMNYSEGKIETLNKAGGAPAPLITVPGGVSTWDFHIDGGDLYWVAQQEQDALMRLKKGTATPEKLWQRRGQYIQSVSMDACNLYFSVVNPPQIVVRGK